MLQSLRDSLKGTAVAVVVLILFIVPLVITGVAPDFLGNAVGSDAAVVDGKSISEIDVRRAVAQRRNQMLSRDNVDPTADELKDENLRGPVIENLTKRAAIIVAAEDGGMGVPEETILKQIREIPNFQIDGKFDSQTYQRVLNSVGYTPAEFRSQFAEDLLVTQHSQGIQSSAFATESEVNALVALTQQKRSFFTLTIPKSSVSEEIVVSDEEIQAYYDENKEQYVDPEKMSVDYIELSAKQLAETIEVTDEEILAQYEQELASFDASTDFEIAHILIESKDNQEALVEEVKGKLAEGAEFESLVAEYSDDLGSKDIGGNLGVLTPGVFPEPFEQAVYTLNEGEVSEPVTTDAGQHFIKVVKRTENKPPEFEKRRDAIAEDIRLAEAETLYIQDVERLRELAFNSPDLGSAADSLGLNVKTSAVFTRNQGEGIASSNSVREAAFGDEVLLNGYNSPVLELANDRAIVVRKKTHSPERIKSLDEMRDMITATLKDEKLNAQLEALVADAKEASVDLAAAETFAGENNYAFQSYDKVGRAGSGVDFRVASKAFSLDLGEQDLAMDSVVDREGNHVLVGVNEVIPGSAADMEAVQLNGLKTQVTLQGARSEASNYEAEVIAEADIKIK